MNNKNKSKTFILGLTVAALLPLSFYFIVVWMVKRDVKSGKIHMPHYYVADSVTKNNDTLFHKVTDIELTNQLGQVISVNKDLKSKCVVIDFFFVNCPTICPRLTANMKLLERAFKKNDTMVQLLSITVNPGHDSFPVLRSYADRFDVNHDNWWFLTGNKKTIYDYARNQLFVSLQPGDGGPDDFIHTQKLVLLDRNRYIRGYYDGLDSADIKRCADDIILLSLERPKMKKH
ncbi:MAG: SCO family protein [Taibaiella sp.]|nr:SCO family protein [Taibaiella sp.]